jgi:isopenicillin N synthase-like dioxygenase
MAASVHGAFQSLPEVDVSGLYDAELETRRAASRELVRACREAGFFYLSGHRVERELSEALLE